MPIGYRHIVDRVIQYRATAMGDSAGECCLLHLAAQGSHWPL